MNDTNEVNVQPFQQMQRDLLTGSFYLKRYSKSLFLDLILIHVDTQQTTGVKSSEIQQKRVIEFDFGSLFFHLESSMC